MSLEFQNLQSERKILSSFISHLDFLKKKNEFDKVHLKRNSEI